MKVYIILEKHLIYDQNKGHKIIRTFSDKIKAKEFLSLLKEKYYSKELKEINRYYKPIVDVRLETHEIEE